MSLSRPFVRRGSHHGHRLGLVQGRLLRIGPQKNDNDNDNVTTNKLTKRQLSIVADERTTHRRSHSDASARQHLSIDRSYHATPNPQILPLLAAGIVGITAVYGYRALRQMDADWDDYYERLEEYEAERTGSNASDVVSSLFAGGTLAVDSGSSFLKVAHRNARGGTRPEVVVDGEGQRSIPAFFWMSSRDGEVAELLVGRMAAGRRYDSRGGMVSSTRDALQHLQDKDLERGVLRSIRTAASDALERVLGGDTNRSLDSASAPLFVLDPSVAVHGAYNVRPVFTYPPGFSNNQNDNHFSIQTYMNVVQQFVSPKEMALFVPEPVAALIGAEYYNLLPPANDDNNNKPVLVVDVGGTTTYVSIVSSEQRRHPNVLYSSSMPWGGDTFVDLLTRHLIHSFYGPDHDSTHRVHDDDDDDNNNSTSAPSSRPTLNDPAALQRLHDASAAALQELTRKTRCRINIPYLSIDMQTKRPKHLELDVARTVLDAHVESFLRNELVSHLLQTSKQSAHTVLSQHLPPPADLSSLFASAMASAMERSSLAPPSLRAVLLVGGGSRIPLVRRAVRRAAENLGGDAFLGRMVVPEGEMGTELTVLGAALWGGGGAAMERR
ncbi:hypothetical protein ACHAW6_010850 [Cyclotella cf. meneghiniana]